MLRVGTRESSICIDLLPPKSCWAGCLGILGGVLTRSSCGPFWDEPVFDLGNVASLCNVQNHVFLEAKMSLAEA